MEQYYAIDDIYYALYHHGIKGQKWGIRRFQNKDGTLTDKGKKRESRELRNIDKIYGKTISKHEKKIAKLQKKHDKSYDPYKQNRLKEKISDKNNELKFYKAMQKLEHKKISDANVMNAASHKKTKSAIAASLLTVGGVTLAATTGVGFVARPRSKNTYVTENEAASIARANNVDVVRLPSNVRGQYGQQEWIAFSRKKK